jgi:hypothetical protein
VVSDGLATLSLLRRCSIAGPVVGALARERHPWPLDGPRRPTLPCRDSRDGDVSGRPVIRSTHGGALAVACAGSARIASKTSVHYSLQT